MTIGVIGCGNMGSALIRGMIGDRSKTCPQKGARPQRGLAPLKIVAWDPDGSKLLAMKRRFGIRTARSNREVACSPVVLLAVKPQQMAQVLEEIRPRLNHRTLLISIAAGIPTRWIERIVGRGIRVIRVMPNTPALVGAGISAVTRGKTAEEKDLKITEKILGVVGQVIRVPERWMDAVTAVSGSGPAYFFFLMDEMIRAGGELGLSPSVVRQLVLQTAVGAAKLAKDSKEEPSDLRARVASKGGTTEAAFRVYEKAHLGKILRRGILAAAQRAKELTP